MFCIHLRSSCIPMRACHPLHCVILLMRSAGNVQAFTVVGKGRIGSAIAGMGSKDVSFPTHQWGLECAFLLYIAIDRQF